jgi:hypothetical protein
MRLLKSSPALHGSDCAATRPFDISSGEICFVHLRSHASDGRHSPHGCIGVMYTPTFACHSHIGAYEHSSGRNRLRSALFAQQHAQRLIRTATSHEPTVACEHIGDRRSALAMLRHYLLNSRQLIGCPLAKLWALVAPVAPSHALDAPGRNHSGGCSWDCVLDRRTHSTHAAIRYRRQSRRLQRHPPVADLREKEPRVPHAG